MIVTKEKNSIAKNPTDDINKLDGTYYGIICNVSAPIYDSAEKYYYCFIYIPEVYGVYNQDAQNYPSVKIPFKQDSDDEGTVPEIGDICKVMFEAGCGNNNSCKFIYYIPLTLQSKILNRNYILYNILPTSLVSVIDDPKAYEKFRGDFLDLAYYITTGHNKNELIIQDFLPFVLGSRSKTDSVWWGEAVNDGESAARNYFCTALGMPFYSYLTPEIDIVYQNAPIESSDLYNVSHVILDLYNNNFNSLKYIDQFFDDSKYSLKPYPPEAIIAPPDIYTTIYNDKDITMDKREFMFYSILSLISFCSPEYMWILFPDFPYGRDILARYFTVNWKVDENAKNKNYTEYLWYRYNDNSGRPYSYAYSKFFYNFRDTYELEWLRNVPVMLSGLNNNNIIYDINDTKLKYTIVFCLTICPLLMYPLFLYERNTHLDEILKSSLSNPSDYASFITYLGSIEEFTEISKKLRLLSRNKTTPLAYIRGFRDIAYGVFGDGKLYINGSLTNTWNYYNMDDKFERLKDKIDTFLEKII